LKALEAVLFPIIGEMAFELIRKNTAPFVVIDAAMLIEANWRPMCDRVLYIDAPRDHRVQRVRDRSGWSDADLAERESSQLPVVAKKAQADEIVMNDGTIDSLRLNMDQLMDRWNIRRE
jgi:dephospho-CoA kinase